MNKIFNNFLLTGDQFLPELHLKQPGFTYSACGSFTKHRKIILKFRETGNLKNLNRNELDKACFAHDTAHSNSKDFTKRTISDKILKDRAFEIARNCGYDGYQQALASMVYKFFGKKAGSGIIVNEQLVKELHKAIIKKFKRRKVCAKFKDNILAPDLVEIGSFFYKNKKVKYLSYVIDVFTKYAGVKLLKDRTVLHTFIEIVNESNHKPNKLLVD